MDYFKLACEITENQSGGLRPAPAAHTPGPWKDRIATGTPDHMISGKGFAVCVVPFKFGHGDAQATATRNANARLIAAAPDLLDALRGCIDLLGEIKRLGEADLAESNPDFIKRARAAIQKATEGA